MATQHSRTADDPVDAGFWRRCAARLIDGLIVGAVSTLLIGLIDAFVAGNGASSSIGDIAGFAIGWLYVALQESSAMQATLGKRAMGIKVTDEEGHRIGFGRATFRFFGQLLSVAIAGIGFLMAGWTARRQALHDKLAGTLVVFRDVGPGGPVPKRRPPMPWYGWIVNLAGIGLLAYLVVLIVLLRTTYGAYEIRSQIAESLIAGDAAKLAIGEFYIHQERCPVSAVEAGFEEDEKRSDVFHVAIEPECHVVITFNGSDAVKSPLRDQRIDITMTAMPDESGLPTWRCVSTVPASYRPAGCEE
ncbi:MAG TPA: RDD family protein [Rhodanobacteraceae bacterium]|jgi:uncharacterized RDD family membrane protein YckC|nr:RDD family protein [Rhodanobacteraceae bacterium]